MENDWMKNLAQAQRAAKRDIKRLDKSLEQAHAQLAEALSWDKVRHEAVLLQSNLYMAKDGALKITVQDWENEGSSAVIHLEPRIPLDEQLKNRFKLSKKLHRSIPHHERRVADLKRYADLAQEKLALLESIRSEEEWNNFVSSVPSPSSPRKSINSSKPAPPRLPYKTYLSSGGIEIWVGRSARDNETLTLKLARGNDWWAHTADVPGSHVVIRSDAPDNATIEEAMQLALANSKLAKSGEGDVILTQRKYIGKGPGGHRPGTVSVSKHKTYKIREDKKVLAQLQSRA